MFGMNFLKKKSEPFSLDDHSLPNLSSTPSSSESSSSFDFPSEEDESHLNQMNDTSQAINHQDSVPYDPPLSGSNGSSSSSFSQPMDLGIASQPSSMNSSSNTSSQFQGSDSSIHDEISRSKLDTMEAKMALMEARLSGIEHKLELVLTMLKHEISDETRTQMGIEKAKASWKK